MADDYADLVELGFEGVDRVTDKYHDHIYGLASKAPRPHFHKKKNKKHPPPPQQPPPSEPRARSERREPRGESDPEEEPKVSNMYASERKRERDWDADSNVSPSDGGYYAQPTGNAVVRRPPIGYEVARRAPSPPSDYGRQRDFGDYGDGWVPSDRRPYAPRMRSYSYSPPRRDVPREEYHGRKRSTSPNHHRAVATIVGALAGGVIGHRMNKGSDSTMSTVTTVAGAVIGGIAAREGEKIYDRHKEEKYEREERGERRAQRRREREDGYGY